MGLVRAFENEQEDVVILPEEIFVIEPVTDVDVTAEIITVEQMDQSIAELIDVFTDMEDAGGMSQRFALEAERILPGIMGRPVNFHTAAPSATHYRVSLEEVHKGIWALAAAAAVAVMAAIYKIYKWLTGDSADGGGKGGGGGGGAAGKVEAAKAEVQHIATQGPEVAQAMTDANKELHSNPITLQDKNGKTKEYRDMESVIEALFLSESHYSKEKSLLQNPDPIHYDIIHERDYSKHVDMLSKARLFHEAATQIKDRLKVIEELIHEDRNSEGNHVLNTASRLKNTASPIKVKVNSSFKTFREIHADLSAARNKAASFKPPARLHYDDTFRRMEHVFKKKELLQLLVEIDGHLPVVQEMHEHIAKLNGWLGDLTTDGQPGGNSPQVAQSVREVLSVLGQQVTGFAGLCNEVLHYVNDNKRLVQVVVGFGKEIVREVSKRYPDDNLPSGWKTIRAQIQGAHKALQEAHYPSGYKDPTAGR